MQAIVVKDLTKVYKTGKKALSELSLEVQQGEIFTLLGSNGAGKSTLINILNTSADFTSGEVMVLGKPIKERNSIRKDIACVSQHVSLFEHLTLEENLKFQGRLFGQSKEEIRKSTQRFIDSFNLQEFTDKEVSVYSGGVRRRIDIAMSMISKPKLLFMDEPTVALDIVSRKALWDTIRKIKDEFGTTIFLTTHYLEEADELSDTICIMKDGHQVIQDTPAMLKKYIKTNLIRIELFSKNDISVVKELIGDLPFARQMIEDENTLTIGLSEKGSNNNEEEVGKIQKYLATNNIAAKLIEVVVPSLDDVFLSIINGCKE